MSPIFYTHCIIKGPLRDIYIYCKGLIFNILLEKSQNFESSFQYHSYILNVIWCQSNYGLSQTDFRSRCILDDKLDDKLDDLLCTVGCPHISEQTSYTWNKLRKLGFVTESVLNLSIWYNPHLLGNLIIFTNYGNKNTTVLLTWNPVSLLQCMRYSVALHTRFGRAPHAPYLEKKLAR